MNSEYHVKSVEGFFQTDGWQIPGIMYDLFEEPWYGINGPVYLNK